MPSFSKYIAELDLVQSNYFTDNGDGTIDVRGDGLEDQNGNPVAMGTVPTGSSGKGYINVALSSSTTGSTSSNTQVVAVDISGPCIAALNNDLGAGNWTYPVTVGFQFTSTSTQSYAARVAYGNHEIIAPSTNIPTYYRYTSTGGYENVGGNWSQSANPERWVLTVDNATDWPAVSVTSQYVTCTILFCAASEFGTYSAPAAGTLNSVVGTSTTGSTSSNTQVVAVDISGPCIAALNSDHGIGNWTYPCTVNFQFTSTSSQSYAARVAYGNHEIIAPSTNVPTYYRYTSTGGYENVGGNWSLSANPEYWSLEVSDASDWPIAAITSQYVTALVQSVTATPYP